MEADRSNLFICVGDVGEITVCPPPLKYKNKHSKQKLSLSKLPVWLPIAAQIKGGNRNNSDTNSRDGSTEKNRPSTWKSHLHINI